MNIAEHKKYYTANEFWEYCQRPENRERRLELREGVLHDYGMSPMGEEHGDISAELILRIRAHTKANDLGRVTAPETGYVLHKATHPGEKDTILAPDVGFVGKARMSNKPSRKFAQLAPDLAVEVISPNDDPEELSQKIALYLKYGTKLVWVFDPMPRTVTVHAPNAAHRILTGDDTLDGGDILPGFTVKVSEISG